MKRLWNFSLVKKLFFSYFAVALLLVLGFYVFSITLIRDFHITTLSSRLEQEAHLLGRVLPFGIEGDELDAACRQLAGELGSRITVIALDGKVLGDSAEPSAKMENHFSRPEVIEALKSVTGSAERYSTTVGFDMLYRAFHQRNDKQQRIVRIAIPLKELDIVIRGMRRSLITGLILASVAGLLLAWWFTNYLRERMQRLVQFSGKIAQGIYPQAFFSGHDRDEIGLLERQLNNMSQRIRDNLAEIAGEKDKADSILRCMIEGVLVLDPKGNVLVINDQAKTMFQVPAGREVHGASVLEISRHPDIRSILDEAVRFDFTSAPYSKEIELEGGRWFSVNAAPLRNAQRMTLGSILVFHDVTEVKRLETIRSDFVANVSHELRTPLTAIQGYVETLIHSPPADSRERQQFLEIIERHAERLGRLTEDLLSLADLESGKIQIAPRPVDSGKLIQQVLEIFWERAAKKEIRLNHEISAAYGKINGDPDRLQQLLINLVDNAVKFTPSGGTVTIRAAECQADNGARRIEISIADSGVGIPEKDLPRLTERFYRVDKARSRDLGGTGLGLAIVKHIVQAHGGELKITSELNKGTTISVRLPIVENGAASNDGILFLCTGNSCRSQMAEGFARRLVHNGQKVYSAGTSPKGVHPLAVRVMQEVGIDISSQESKGLDKIPLRQIGHLITLCDDAAESCATLPGGFKRTHWPSSDPVAAHGTEAEVLPHFRLARDQIRERIAALYSKP
ncbi:MAG TPA: ATP-binding protein [Candidatus Limnocylindria bacterium]|nr:ATP-binding protein [Candidatus Limnocylindria bacterium]